MAMISAPLKAEIAELVKTSSGQAYNCLQALDILNTRIAFALHRSNPVRTASGTSSLSERVDHPSPQVLALRR